MDFVLWHLLWRRPSIALINPVTGSQVTSKIRLGLSLLLDFLLTLPLLGILRLPPQWFNQLLCQPSYPLQAIGHLLYLQAALWVQTFPLSRIIELLLPLLLCLATALTCVSAWEVQRKRLSFVHVAWEAGLWAKATLEGIVPKPRPTPKFHLRPTVYIIIRAPSVSRPVRVDSAAEYFRLIPSFSGSSSISHSFASVAEARVYCAGVGIALPDPQ